MCFFTIDILIFSPKSAFLTRFPFYYQSPLFFSIKYLDKECSFGPQRTFQCQPFWLTFCKPWPCFATTLTFQLKLNFLFFFHITYLIFVLTFIVTFFSNFERKFNVIGTKNLYSLTFIHQFWVSYWNLN